jgi:(p)ppGpp synthase/HD superfamily hydrolase
MDEDLAVQCAVLHDVIEDTPCGYDEVKLEFGPDVADGVLALSKNPELPDKTSQMDDSLARILLQPQEIWMVKMADRIGNLLAAPYFWTKEDKAFYHLEAIKIHQTLQAANQIQAERLWQKIEIYRSFFEE